MKRLQLICYACFFAAALGWGTARAEYVDQRTWRDFAPEVASFEEVDETFLQGYDVVDGVLFQNQVLICYPGQKADETYAVPPGTLAIHQAAFYYANPQALREIALPASCVYIDNDAWERQGFDGIQYFRVAEGNPAFSSVDGVLYSQSGKRLVCYPRGRSAIRYQVPEGTGIIDAFAFVRCSLTAVAFPATLREIRAEAFALSDALTQVTFNEGLRVIGVAAFANCEALTDIRLPSSLKVIEPQAFMCCQISSVTLPEGLRELWDEAFFANPVEEIHFSRGLEYIGELVVSWQESPGDVYAPTVYAYPGSYAYVYARLHLPHGQMVDAQE